MKSRKRDERITNRRTWLVEGIAMFVILLLVNGSQILIYQSVLGIEESFRNLLVPEIIGFLFFVAAVLCVMMMIGRNIVYEKPIEDLGNAARQIAAGDFSVRLPVRHGKKKDRLDILNEDFNTMAEELASTETLKTDFIANVSHEIRTPLAVIHNYADALRKESLSPQGLEYLETIKAASINMSRMVSNLLQLSSLENKEILPEPVLYNLSEQLTLCALNYSEKWEAKGIAFEADIDEEVYGCYDRYVLEIVWNNLMDNAIKFTAPGGSIKISLKAENGHAVAAFTDTGCGIDKETGKHIFSKFYQGDPSHSQEGNGLGLALVHKIIDLCEGSIRVDSQPGQGSTFTVYLNI